MKTPKTIKSIKVRKSFGKVRPCSVRFKDRKKEKNRTICRGKVNY